MILRKIAIFPNSEYDREYAYTGQAVRVLSENGILSILSSAAKPFFQDLSLSVQFCDTADGMMDACDAILVLGGDGTMIDYSVRAAEKDKPAIGINLGHLGFLMALERTEIEKLALLAQDDFTVESRMLLDAQILLGGELLHSQRILNDIVAASGVRSKIAEFSLSCTPGGVLDYRADGIIVATPTGSTAYSFSAGGPIIDPTASVFSVMPVCPHSLLSRAVLLAPENALTLSGRTRDAFTDIHVTMDGKNARMIPKEAEIHIRKSEYTAKIIKIGATRFYDILETKLNKK
ncbi:MAG: NAD(+)/NADH kinase [Clostridia bacterium]|nr:NAD(+)/NADH kinase [Clostridia bacterium]MBR6743969.1 NAD(+)/NADH kinase [Clostridia bacterium]